MRRPLTTTELRSGESIRSDFVPRRRSQLCSNGQNCNIGAILQLCDAFLVERLMICGTKLELHKRKLVQAAQGTQRWVPCSERQHPSEAVADAKSARAWIVVAEQITASV